MNHIMWFFTDSPDTDFQAGDYLVCGKCTRIVTIEAAWLEKYAERLKQLKDKERLRCTKCGNNVIPLSHFRERANLEEYLQARMPYNTFVSLEDAFAKYGA